MTSTLHNSAHLHHERWATSIFGQDPSITNGEAPDLDIEVPDVATTHPKDEEASSTGSHDPLEHHELVGRWGWGMGMGCLTSTVIATGRAFIAAL